MKLLTPKELGSAIGRNRIYIEAMKRDGFEMPGGMATVQEAREWLKKHPKPRRRAGILRNTA